MDPRLERLVPAAALTVAAVLSGVSAAVTLQDSPSEHALLEAVGRASMVGAPIAVGAYAWRLPYFKRFGSLLIAAGVVWFLASLSESPNSVLYSAGRLSAWVVEVVLLYAVLAFPTGRLPGRADRVLVGGFALVVAVLFLPTALLVEQYPLPSPWTACSADCPANAFMVVGSEPAFVADLVRPLREALTVAILAAATVVLSRRIVGASRLRRLMLTPVLAVAGARVALLATGFVVRRRAPDSQWVEVFAWLIALAVPATALAFLVGLVRWRLFVARAMQRFAGALSPHPRPEDLRTALADAFDDKSLEIAYWLDDGGWGDANGDAVELPDGTPERAVTEVWDGDRRVAAIVCDAALRDEPALIAAATSYAVMTLDNQRLSVQTAGLLREVDRSRARIQRSADDERRRIERDLHDGAQQRLVALRIKLELTAEQIDSGSQEGDSGLLRALGEDVDASTRRDPLPRARDLPGPTRSRPRRSPSVRGAAGNAADHGARGGHRPLSAGDRERRVLLLRGGAAERRQARRGSQRGGHRGIRRWRPEFRGARRRGRLRHRRRDRGRRPHQHARPPRRRRRRAGDQLEPGPRHTRARHDPARREQVTGSNGETRTLALPACLLGSAGSVRTAIRRLRWVGRVAGRHRAARHELHLDNATSERERRLCGLIWGRPDVVPDRHDAGSTVGHGQRD